MCNPSNHRILHQQTLKDCGVPQVVVSFLFRTSFFINDSSHFCIQFVIMYIWYTVYTFVYAWFDYTYILMHISHISKYMYIYNMLILLCFLVFIYYTLSQNFSRYWSYFLAVVMWSSLGTVTIGLIAAWRFFSPMESVLPGETPPNRMAIVNLPTPQPTYRPQKKSRAY